MSDARSLRILGLIWGSWQRGHGPAGIGDRQTQSLARAGCWLLQVSTGVDLSSGVITLLPSLQGN